MVKKTTEQYIKEAKKVHGNKYDYSLVKYKRSNEKIKIICPIHGEFLQNPRNHLERHGCYKCGRNMITEEQFIEQANKIHNNKYDYSLVNYVNSSKKVKIICPEHGIYKQSPGKHLAGQSCKKCMKYKLRKHFQLPKKEVIKRAKKVHGDKYDYSLIDYKNLHDKVDILCPKHGIFPQELNSHIRGGHGCPKCACSKYNSKASNNWLDEKKVYNREVPLNMKNGKQYIVDGFDEENNIVYEFFGDFFHGNPEIYDLNDFNKRIKVKFGILYNKTIDKIKHLIMDGYNVIYKWETLPHDIGFGEQDEEKQ